MADLTLVCESCGSKFVWTEREQEESGLDAAGVGGLVDVEPFCKGCRKKQDDQRS